MRTAMNLATVFSILLSGCVKSDSIRTASPFEERRLDGCLAILIDTSGSFANYWDDRAYKLFLELSESYFVESRGGDNRLVIAALSGSDRVVLFEGRPSELQNRFSSPRELSDFLLQQSDANSSRVYEAMESTLGFVRSIPGVTDQTRLMTVVLSDMRDSESDQTARKAKGYRMLKELKQYREAGGALALYFVANEQTPRWRKILDEAGFEPGQFVIENELTSTPRLPQFN